MSKDDGGGGPRVRSTSWKEEHPESFKGMKVHVRTSLSLCLCLSERRHS